MSDPNTSAQDPRERFDLVRADGTPLGRTKSRATVHRDGDWHRAVHVWIAGIDERGERFLLFQRRSPWKDTWPGRLDATVGGHVRAGETVEETLRETEEEIGLGVSLDDLRPLGVRICANEREPGIVDRELQEVFFLRGDRPLTAYRPHPVELAALVRVRLTPLLAFLAGETASIDVDSFAPGADRVVPVALDRDDFIPSIDRYFYRVAIAADLALSGARHVTV